MVFQQYALFPHMTVIDNVCYGLKVRKRPKAEREERGREVLELVGLSGYEDRLPRQLSGGQQQRVALARAIAFEPTMLLMDEPLGALDRELRVRMAGELRRLHDQLGNTVVYVTHDREEALTLSDRIAVMREGRLEADGSPQELYGRPSTSFVATFFGGHNLVPCTVASDRSVSIEGKLEVKCLDESLEVNLSESAVDGSGEFFLSVPGDGFEIEGSSGSGAPGTVHSAVYMGNQIQVTCDVPIAGREPARIRVDLPGGRAVPPAVGETIWLRVVPEAATLVRDRKLTSAGTALSED